MSNKIVPSIYRTVIDDVIANIKPEFDEYGVTQEVLDQLQDKWEQKVINSRVAEFENNPPPPPPAPVAAPAPAVAPPPIQQPAHHPHLPQLAYPMYSFNYAPPPGPQPQVKAEPADAARYQGLYQLPKPGVPGTTIPGMYAPQPPRPQSGQPQQQPRIPQADGPSAQPPRPTHPSLQPTGPPRPPVVARPVSVPAPAPLPTPAPRAQAEDDEEINSDLDDSDSDIEQNGEEQATSGATDGDIVFCTYDKVQRVKNKWKCVLKDGVIHMNGRDYLFSKCTGEFEW